MVTDEVKERLASQENLASVVLFGIEAHVCVLQTALDLRQMGLDVHVVADACSSRNLADRMLAFEVCSSRCFSPPPSLCVLSWGREKQSCTSFAGSVTVDAQRALPGLWTRPSPSRGHALSRIPLTQSANLVRTVCPRGRTVYHLQRMRQSGVFVTTSEAVIFELLGDAKHPQFKKVQALIKTVAPDSELVPGVAKK